MDFYQTASQLQLTAAEKSAIKSATDRISKAQEHAAKYGGASQLHQTASPTQIEINELSEKFKAAPTPELAAEIASKTVLQSNLAAVANQFDGINTQLRDGISRSLETLAQKLTARTIEALDQQLRTAEDGLAKIGGLESTTADLRAKHARQVEIGNYDCGELREGHRDCLGWIMSTFVV